MTDEEHLEPSEPETRPAAPGQEHGGFDPAELTADSKNWALFAHLSTFVGLIGVPFGNILGPLVIWLVKRNDDPFIERHAREALNFNISLTIYGAGLVLVGLVLLVVFIGFLFLIAAAALVVLWVVFTIIAALNASRGDEYEYPLTLRLVH
jgi:uncharacterized Tic20 family protein